MKAKWLVWLLLLPIYASAQKYTAINLPAKLGTSFHVAGINPSGTEIVGTYYDGTKTDGVRIANGVFSKIAFPSAGASFDSGAAGVNDSGEVVGACTQINPFIPISPQYGLIYYGNGGYSTYVKPGPEMTWFSGVNNQGMIVGYYQLWGCDGRSCARRGMRLSSNGVWIEIYYAGSSNTWTTGINNLGEIVGNYEDATGEHGFTWVNGRYYAFTTVSGGTLVGINDSGDLVGTNSSGGAFLVSGGVVHTITYPGASATSVWGVANRKGSTVEVVGNYTDSGGASHGYSAVVTLPQGAWPQEQKQ